MFWGKHLIDFTHNIHANIQNIQYKKNSNLNAFRVWFNPSLASRLKSHYHIYCITGSRIAIQFSIVVYLFHQFNIIHAHMEMSIGQNMFGYGWFFTLIVFNLRIVFIRMLLYISFRLNEVNTTTIFTRNFFRVEISERRIFFWSRSIFIKKCQFTFRKLHIRLINYKIRHHFKCINFFLTIIFHYFLQSFILLITPAYIDFWFEALDIGLCKWLVIGLENLIWSCVFSICGPMNGLDTDYNVFQT